MALQHGLLLRSVFQKDPKRRRTFPPFRIKALEIRDKPFVLQDPGDLQFYLRKRDVHPVFYLRIRIANACEHVCDRIHDYLNSLGALEQPSRGDKHRLAPDPKDSGPAKVLRANKRRWL